MQGWDKTHDWFWEGNVQERILKYMREQEGFEIVKVCDTKTKGPDILAKRNGKIIQVEVKGYPSDKYVNGLQKGERKPTKPRSQAKHWYAEVLLSLVLAKEQDSELQISIGLPRFTRYLELLENTAWARSVLGIKCYLVTESGDIQII